MQIFNELRLIFEQTLVDSAALFELAVLGLVATFAAVVTLLKKTLTSDMFQMLMVYTLLLTLYMIFG